MHHLLTFPLWIFFSIKVQLFLFISIDVPKNLDNIQSSWSPLHNTPNRLGLNDPNSPTCRKLYRWLLQPSIPKPTNPTISPKLLSSPNLDSVRYPRTYSTYITTILLWVLQCWNNGPWSPSQEAKILLRNQTRSPTPPRPRNGVILSLSLALVRDKDSLLRGRRSGVGRHGYLVLELRLRKDMANSRA